MVRIVWGKQAVKQLTEAYEFIKEDSPKAATKVRDAILDKIEDLKDKPEIHPMDKYRVNNDGSFRAFEIFKYRVAYQVTDSEIRILRVRHTKMEPLDY